MPSYKLHYFDVRGSGEIARLMFAYAGQQFEDIRYGIKESPRHQGPDHEFKKKAPFGQLPVLDVDGKLLPQSGAIFRYIGKQFGLSGKTDFEAAWVDALANQFKDYYTDFGKFYYLAIGYKEGDKQARKEFGEPARDKFFALMTEQLKKNKSGFLVGDGVTSVDFLLAEHVLSLHKNVPGFLDGFPEVLEHQKKIHGLPQVKDYVAARKDSPF